MTSEASLRQLCTFRIDGVLFGVDVMHVQEVIRHQEMTPIPLAPAVVTGLINLRGQIVTALDMRTRLGMSARGVNEEPVNIVVRADDGIVSLLVDEIGDVLEVDDQLFETTPDTLDSSARALIEGVYKLSPQLLLVLDTKRAARLEADGPTKDVR